MKKCSDCGRRMEERTDTTPEGVLYHYFQCGKCGEEIVDMKQLQQVATVYRKMKQYHAKVSRWGTSLGVRIPKELVQRYHFKDDEEVTIVPEERWIKIIPA